MRGMRWSVTTTATSCLRSRARPPRRRWRVRREGLAESEAESVEVVAFVVDNQDGKFGQSDFTHGHGHDGNIGSRASDDEERGRFDPQTCGALAVGLAAFVAYVSAATPAAYPLDSAELATAAFGLGVAHPPGEETTLLLAKLFTLLPFGVDRLQGGPFTGRWQERWRLCWSFCSYLTPADVSLVRPEATGAVTPAVVAAAAALAFAYAPGVVIVEAIGQKCTPYKRHSRSWPCGLPCAHTPPTTRAGLFGSAVDRFGRGQPLAGGRLSRARGGGRGHSRVW